MVTRYGKPVMICEVGMSWTDSPHAILLLQILLQKQNLLPVAKGWVFFIGNQKAIITGRAIRWVHLIIQVKPTIALDAFK